MIRTQGFANGGPDMAKPKLQPEQAVPEAEKAAAVAESAPEETQPVAETIDEETGEEVEPVAEEDVEEVEEPVAEPAAAVHDLGAYMSAFGDAEGAKMFRDGISWQDAQQAHVDRLAGELQDLKAEMAQLREQAAAAAQASPDEAEGVNVAADKGYVSWADACRGKQN
jgi:outer membrane murein-binding lipoprotein Lpp